MGLRSKRKLNRARFGLSPSRFGISPSRIEILEQRKLLSGAGAPDTITQDGSGLVTITGTVQSDDISVETDPGNAANWLFAVITPGINTVTASFAKAGLTGVSVFCDPANSTPVGPDADVVNFGGFVFGGTAGIELGAGSDTVFGQNGPNLIDGSFSNGNNVLFGGIGNDTIRGGNGNNRIAGGLGNDTLFGGSGNNVINGGGGDDQIIGGGGHDTLRAGPGNDTITGGSNGSLLIGGSGSDYIQGGAGNDTIIGGGGNSTLLGGAGNDFIGAHWENFLAFNGGTPLTSSGQSLLYGGGGNDTLSSNGGTDLLTGGGGANSFDVGANATIEDPSHATYISKDDTYSSGNPAVVINISLTINLNLGGSIFPVTIPINAGSTPTGNSTALATSSTGHIHFRSDAARTFTLADFFNHWGVNFNSSGVGQFIVLGNGHTLSMTVNGIANNQFDAYAVHNGDNIVITYTQ